MSYNRVVVRLWIARALIVAVFAASGALCGATLDLSRDPHKCCSKKGHSKQEPNPQPVRCCLMTAGSPKATVAVGKSAGDAGAWLAPPVWIEHGGPGRAHRVEPRPVGAGGPGSRYLLLRTFRL
jgi:hypothetical protein